MNILKNVQIHSAEALPILLDVYFKTTRKQKPVVVFCHGFKTYKDWGAMELIAKEFAMNDFVFLKFNFSHNGTTVDNPFVISDAENFGNSNIQNELDDIDSVLGWIGHNSELSSDEVNIENIYIIGHSRGGSTAILKASADERIKKLVTWAAFSDFGEIWERYDVKKWEETGVSWTEDKFTGNMLPLYYQHYQNYIDNRDNFSVKKAVESLKIPLLLIHGMEDDQVGYEDALKIKGWNNKIEMSLLPNAGHNLGCYHPYKGTKLPFDTKIAIKDCVDFFKGKFV
jgi:pimeloyl-ACP methyl ester carboxylesterase